MRLSQILLIDDDGDEQILLCHALDAAGIRHHCTWAGSVEDGLVQLHHRPFDIIFIDLNMPRINGLEGIRLIRKLPSTASTPLILYSTGLTEASQKQALAAGATCCLAKEMNSNKMVEKVRGLWSTVSL